MNILIFVAAFFAVGLSFNVRRIRQIDPSTDELEDLLIRSDSRLINQRIVEEVPKSEADLTVYSLPGEVFSKLDGTDRRPVNQILEDADSRPINPIVPSIKSNSLENDNSDPVLDFDDEKVVPVIKKPQTLSTIRNNEILAEIKSKVPTDDLDNDDSLEDDNESS
uniref:Secreted protein n=1 Tax=Panagrolaimus sp. JU765 TaxID=591449 RepID=A0AC34REG3_9BILA